MDEMECIREFGPHEDHEGCEETLAQMNWSPPDDSHLYDDDPMGYNSDSYIDYLNRGY